MSDTLTKEKPMILPFDDRDGEIWYNGKFVPWRDAKLHILTHSLHYGGAVFEGIRSYDHKIFKLTEHNERFRKSANLLGYEIPYTTAELDKITEETVKRAGHANAYIRPVAWRGSEIMSIGAKGLKVHVAVAVWESKPYFGAEMRDKGLRLSTSRWARPAPNTAPSASKASGLYMICTLSKHEAESKGFDDALMHDYRGNVAEATGANFFMIKDGAVHTPTPECILNGITRLTVIDLAKKRGLAVHERHISPAELQTADECFLTGTAYEIIPIVGIDDTTYTVGSVTRQLRDDYHAAVRA